LRHYGFLRTFGTPHAHTCDNNLGFLLAIGCPVGGVEERGILENRARLSGLVYWLLLPTSTSADVVPSSEHI